jgi:hypothetical protein
VYDGRGKELAEGENRVPAPGRALAEEGESLDEGLAFRKEAFHSFLNPLSVFARGAVFEGLFMKGLELREEAL